MYNWKLEKLGKLLGYDVYIELPENAPRLRGKGKDFILEEARKFFEQSFKNHDFIQSMREHLK